MQRSSCRVRCMKQLDRRWKVFLVTAVAVFMAFLDVTIVNVAFPSIEAAFPSASLAELSWVLNAYNIVFAALLVPAGRLADLLGRRRMFFVGLGLFMVASALCGLAWSSWALVARARAAGRGCGAAGADVARAAAAGVPGGAAGVGDRAVGRGRRRRGGDGAVAGRAADRVGGLAAGVLREPGLGRSPRGFRRGGCCARREIPIGARCRTRSGSRCSPAGWERWRWRSSRRPTGAGAARGCSASFALAVVALAAFVWRSAAHPHPVLELALFRVRSFAAACVGVFVFSLGFYAVLLANILFLTSVWGYSTLDGGLRGHAGAADGGAVERAGGAGDRPLRAADLGRAGRAACSRSGACCSRPGSASSPAYLDRVPPGDAVDRDRRRACRLRAGARRRSPGWSRLASRPAARSRRASVSWARCWGSRS